MAAATTMLLLAEPVPSSNGHDAGSLSGAMIGGIVFTAVGSVVLLLVVCYLYDWSCCKRCWAFFQRLVIGRRLRQADSLSLGRLTQEIPPVAPPSYPPSSTSTSTPSVAQSHVSTLPLYEP